MDIVPEMDMAHWQRKISYPLISLSLCLFPIIPISERLFNSRAIFWSILLQRVEKWHPEGWRMAEAGSLLKSRGRGALCARERWAKGVTLHNFVLNFSVISSKVISLTFSCGIWRGEKVDLFLYQLFFFFSFFQVIYLVFVQKSTLLRV